MKQINRRKSIRPDGAVATILLKISSSTKVLYSEIEKFMMDMRSVLNMKLYPALTDLLYSQAVEGITRKLEEFILVMTKTSQAKKLKKEQFMAIVCNAYYLADDLVPRMKMTVDRLFERKPIEIEAFQIKLQRYFNAQRDSFSQHFAPSWLRNVIDWSLLVNSRYTLDKVNFNVSEIRPADQFFSFVGLLGTIKIDFEKSISKDVSKKVVIRSFVEVLGCLLSDKYSKALTSITLYGLHCFMIDLKFTVAWFTDLADEKLRALAREICNRAVSIFQEQNPSVSVAENLLSDAEYESMVQSVFSHQSVKCIKEYKPSPR